MTDQLCRGEEFTLCLEKEVTHSINSVHLTSPGPSTVGRTTTRHVNGFVHNYCQRWMAPSLSAPNCSESIFLSDERGERQHPVISCFATAGNSKSPAQSHPRFEMARGGVWWDGRGGHTAVDSATWEYPALWRVSCLLPLWSSSKWIIEMVVQNYQAFQNHS